MRQTVKHIKLRQIMEKRQKNTLEVREKEIKNIFNK
jgi:hypothetical protein